MACNETGGAESGGEEIAAPKSPVPILVDSEQLSYQLKQSVRIVHT